MKYMNPETGYIYKDVEELEEEIKFAFDRKDEDYGYIEEDSYEDFRERIISGLDIYSIHDALRFVGFKTMAEVIEKVREITGKSREFCEKLANLCIWGIESPGDFEIKMQIYYDMTKEQTSELVDLFDGKKSKG